MPIYEYQCQSCGKQLEILQKISDPLLSECPACQQHSLIKKVSAGAFRLKGGGWYETDFKTSGKKNLASGSSDGAPSTAPSGDSKTPSTNTSASTSASTSATSGGSGAKTSTSSSNNNS